MSQMVQVQGTRPGVIVSMPAAGNIQPPNVTNPIGKGPTNQKAANDKAMQAKGAAVAINLIKECERQAGSLKRFLVDIHGLTQSGRTSFRVEIKKSLDTMRATLKALEGTPEYDVMAPAVRSSVVRVSEAVTFSKAIDAGFDVDMDTESYHVLVTSARIFLNGQSAAAAESNNEGDPTATPVGPTRRRGRKATPILDKVKKFLKNNVKPEEMESVCEFLTAWVALQRKD